MRALLWCVCVVAGCASARRGEAVLRAPLQLAENEQRGEVVFMHQCNQCHPGGEAGLGPAINNKPLPRFAIDAQVRIGVGSMPAFSKQEISDEQMKDLLAYVKALHKQGD